QRRKRAAPEPLHAVGIVPADPEVAVARRQKTMRAVARKPVVHAPAPELSVLPAEKGAAGRADPDRARAIGGDAERRVDPPQPVVGHALPALVFAAHQPSVLRDAPQAPG